MRIFLLLFLFISNAQAENLFTPKLISVIAPADDFVITPAEPFILNKNMSFVLQKTILAKAIQSKRFRIRVFALFNDADYPREWATFAPCKVYVTDVYYMQPTRSDTLDFGPIKGLAWLLPSEANKALVGKFRFVFESEDKNWPNNPPSHVRETIRLNQDFEKEYFDKALIVNILPDKKYSDDQIMETIKIGEKNAQAIKDEVKINSPSYPCYKPKFIHADVKSVNGSSIFLAECVSQDTPSLDFHF